MFRRIFESTCYTMNQRKCMQEGRPSQTAFGVARRRAAHQLLDQRPLVLDDPIAVPILGPHTAAQITGDPEKHNHPFARGMRAFMVARSRYAEDQLLQAIHSGVQQYVVLGAGLDTFAYRNPHPAERLSVFEVDHPATQQWKRQLLDEGRIPIPRTVNYVPVDFEQKTLAAGLAESNFDFRRAAFFSWLGVTPYLTLEAFRSTLSAIGALPSGSGVTFEYVLDHSLLSVRERMALDLLAARVEKAGEPFQLFFTPQQMRDELQNHGFARMEELTSDEINRRYFQERPDGLRLHGNVARLITAWV
jgi:methyltransferase (TIGR00027 family)